MEQEGLLNEYIEWHRRKNLAPTLDEMMQLPSANERWSKGGASALEPGAPKVTVILNLFQREVRQPRKKAVGDVLHRKGGGKVGKTQNRGTWPEEGGREGGREGRKG